MDKRIIFIVRFRFMITTLSTSVNNSSYSSTCLGKNMQPLIAKGINPERELPLRKYLYNTFYGKHIGKNRKLTNDSEN